MAKRLDNEDRQAVDLVLDRPDGGEAEAFGNSAAVSPQRVQSVEKILSLLQQMPAQDPPADLVAKTLKRVDQALAALKTPTVQDIAQREERPPA